MSLWFWLSAALVFVVVAIAVTLAMRGADRRARRAMYASLGYDEELIVALMEQKGPISAQLALVRQMSLSVGRSDEVRNYADIPQIAAYRSFRFGRSASEARLAGRDRAAGGAERRVIPRDRREP